MLTGRFDPQVFFQRSENLALNVPAAELFGLLKRSLVLPSQWAALLRRNGSSYEVAPPGGTVDSTDLDEVLFVRVSPVEVVVQENAVATGDQFQANAEVRLRLSIIPDRSELLSFLKSVVGSHRVAQAVSLARYLQPVVRAALSAIAADHDADGLVNGRLDDRLRRAIADAIQPALFSAGMTLAGSPVVRFDSKTLRQVLQARQETALRHAEHEAAHQLREALDRARAAHLERLSSLLSRLKNLAVDSPDVALPDLIRSFAERERGEIYSALFACEPAAQQTRWLVAAAGGDLLFFTADDLETPARKLTIRGGPGTIRSVRLVRDDDGRMVLLLGAAVGLYRLPIERAEPDLVLMVPDVPPVKGGFNAAARAGDRVFASHSELALWEWDLRDPARTRPRFEPLTLDAKTIRCVRHFEGYGYCAIDDRVIRWPIDDPTDRPERIFTGSGAMITALCPTSDGLFAGNSEGDVLHWPAGSDGPPERLHTGSHRASESVHTLSTHGVRRLVYTDTTLYVHTRVLGDSFVCRYEAGGQTLRRVEAAPDLIVATNDLRDRLIVWTPGEPAAPKGVIGVSRLCGHSIQDVCLIPHT